MNLSTSTTILQAPGPVRYNDRQFTRASTMLEAKKPAIRRNQRNRRCRRFASCSEQSQRRRQPAKSYTFPVKPRNSCPASPRLVWPPRHEHGRQPYQFAAQQFPGGGFPGFAYLSPNSSGPNSGKWLPRWRQVDQEWLEFTSKQDDDTDSAEKIKLIEAEFKRLNVRAAIQTGAEHDCYFGRAQIFLEIAGADRSTPLSLTPAPSKGRLYAHCPGRSRVDPPASYNALDPAAPGFYKPSFVVHAGPGGPRVPPHDRHRRRFRTF